MGKSIISMGRDGPLSSSQTVNLPEATVTVEVDTQIRGQQASLFAITRIGAPKGSKMKGGTRATTASP